MDSQKHHIKQQQQQQQQHENQQDYIYDMVVMMKRRLFRHISTLFCVISFAVSFQPNPSIDERRITSLKVVRGENGDSIDNNNNDGDEKQYSHSRRNLLLSTGLSIATSVMIEDMTNQPDCSSSN